MVQFGQSNKLIAWNYTPIFTQLKQLIVFINN